ncbi:MAG: hypothetical protein WA932_03730 [Nitrososphaeraceae archaeon]
MTALESVQDPIYDKKLHQVSADLKQYRLNQLKRMDQTNSTLLVDYLTQEYLRNYIVNRCYDEIVIALPIDVNAMFNKLFAQEISKTREYRLRILDELIAIQQDRLKQMEQEKKYLQSMVQ